MGIQHTSRSKSSEIRRIQQLKLIFGAAGWPWSGLSNNICNVIEANSLCSMKRSLGLYFELVLLRFICTESLAYDNITSGARPLFQRLLVRDPEKRALAVIYLDWTGVDLFPNPLQSKLL